jgi:hypothetical protein
MPSTYSINMIFFIFPVIYLLYLEILELYYKFFNLRKNESEVSFIFEITLCFFFILFCLKEAHLLPLLDEEIFSYQNMILLNDVFYYPHTLLFFISILAFYFSGWYNYIYDLLIDYFQQNYEIILFLFQIFFLFFFFFFFDIFLNYYLSILII